MLLKRLLGAAAGLALAFAVVAQAHAEDVLVFAAASLTNALNEIGEHFTAKTGDRIQFSYAASSTLAKQIEQGAPARIFASADQQWMDYLAERKLIVADTRVNILGNTLVLVAPLDTRLGKVEIGPKTDIAALAGDGRIATGDPDSVPVGLYFRQAMERAGQWDKVAPKLARAESVRAALALVERGEAPLGVVYATDAAVSKKVKVVGVFPESMHDPIIYPFALVAGNGTGGAARVFLDYLRTSDAMAIFAKYGFKPN